VLAGDESGELDALAIGDGSVLWARHLDGVIRGIGSEGDLLFVGTLKGAVFAIRAPALRTSTTELTVPAAQKRTPKPITNSESSDTMTLAWT
jgi:hypothetical protein